MDNLQSLAYFYPELILTVLILACILYDLSIKKEDSSKVGWLLVAGLVIVSVAILFQGSQTITSLFSNAIVLDPFASFFKLVIILSTIFVSIFSLYNNELGKYRMGEYFTLIGSFLHQIEVPL